MTIVKIPETMLVYKALELSSNGMTLQSLAEKSQVPIEHITMILRTFSEDGLISVQNESICPTKWWEQERLELMFQLPWIEDGVFQEICSDLQVFSRELHGENYHTLKPYSHETTLQVIISVVSGIVLAEFFRSFFKEWGTKTAVLCGELFQKYRKHGIKEIGISGTFHPSRTEGAAKFNFDVKASSKEDLISGLEFIEKELMPVLEGRKLSSNFIREADNWKVTVWKA